MSHIKKFVRKLSKQGKYSYYVVIPKHIVEEFGWRERQKLEIRKYGDGVLIKDWKKEK